MEKKDKRKVYLVSLGCPKNSVDSDVILKKFFDAGYELVDTPEEASILLCNTCGFIEDAKKESIDTIFELASVKEKTGAKLIVTGCLFQRYPHELASEIPEVDSFFGTGKVGDVLNFNKQRVSVGKEKVYLNSQYERLNFTTPPHFAYIKVGDGCDRKCSFCAIPLIKGRQKSRSIDSIVEEIRYLKSVQKKLKEVILVAQDTTAYGRDLFGQEKLADLLEEIEKIDGLTWVRILYMYPDKISDKLLHTIKNSKKIVPYFDIPIQHISDKILKLMRRGHNSQTIKKVIEKIRTTIPDAVLRSTFIVGFPGETEKDFIELLDFLEEFEIDNVGAFKYSDEEGTAASKMDGKISEKEKEERLTELMTMQMDISKKRLERFLGDELEVLVEESGKDNQIFQNRGRFYGQAPEIDGEVLFESNEKLEAGEFYRVKIVDNTEYDLIATLLKNNR